MEPKTRTLTFKESSDELTEPGDYCITENLSNVQDSKTISAIVMKCPFCSLDMASMPIHKITRPRWVGLGKLFTLLGLPYGVSVSPMLQCPYNKAHVFNIRKGKLIF